MSRLPSRRRNRPSVERLDERVLMASGLANGVWTIRGIVGPGGAAIDNTIVIRRDPSNASTLVATINGSVVSTQPESSVRLIKVNSGAGNDDIRIDESVGKIAIATNLKGEAGDDRIQGGSGVDLILGGDGDDVLSGGGGRDAIKGGKGNDLIDGGLDDDTLDGGKGRNYVTAGGGKDRMVNGVAAPRALRFGSNDEFRRFLIQSNSRNGAYRGGVGTIADGLIPVSAPTLKSGASAATPTHSGTNVQVDGVDEADIVKTDGNHLYILSRGDLLIVTAARDGQAATIASRTTLEGSPVAEYLEGDRLTVVSSVYGNPIAIDPGIGAGAAVKRIAPSYQYTPPRVKVTQFDLSNRATPKVLQESYLDGSYIDSRSTGGKVYVALQDDAASRMQPKWIPSADGTGGKFETQAAFQARLRSAKLADLAPTFVTKTGGTITRTGLLIDPKQTLRPQAADDQNLLSLVVFDASAKATGPIDSAGVVGSYATTLHASKDNIYLLTPRYSSDGSTDGSTTITKFSLAGGVKLAASGEVPGQVLNQFSVDEFNGNLRIATTISHWNVARGQGVRSTNNLYVLDQSGDSLNIVGRLENIAPNERIFSARFDGEKGYLVTFEQVDPLFTLDLSDPRKPKIVGELKLPGFSRYLQPIGPGLLLGIGRDADPATGRTQDLQVSLFDVSDATSPKRIANTLIAPPGSEWNWSDAEYDHHAISYFPEEKILTIPVSGSVPGADINGDGYPDSYTYKSSLYVYKVDPTAGFALLGTVDHDTTVQRGVRIGNDLYSLADRTLKVNHLDDALSSIGSLTIQTGDPGYPGGPIAIL